MRAESATTATVRGANYIYYDAHVEYLRWSKARNDQYPDHVVRWPLANPPP
jgi:hypothetical protein